MHDADNIIAKYTFANNNITPNFDGVGYFPKTGELKPISEFNFPHEVLDVMTAAAEAGVLRSDSWVCQLFADDEVFFEFMEELSGYNECYRINDRWYRALFDITDAVNEEGFVTSEEIVERMLEQAEKTGQIESQ
ncbi:hypothetical protein IFT43_02080 [Oxalobacteraceae sp. CFBP 13708]|nr:hypothetical protein [Oxalobacteraceae sp. CFBP 13708]